MRKICALFRVDPTDADVVDEYSACNRYFETTKYISTVPSNSLVIGRYSVLPFYQDVQNELALRNCALINTYSQHKFAADFEYYSLVDKYTFPTYFSNFGTLPEGQYVVKGRTNSRKHRWKSHMFASTRSELMERLNTLADDQWIFDQGLVVRKYVPLYQVGEGINGLPITAEYRFFFYKTTMLCYGYYWSSHPEYKAQVDALFTTPFQTLRPEIKTFANDVAKEISPKIPFFVLDIALTDTKAPILVEVNDGQMSGLSSCDPKILYNAMLSYVSY